MWHFTSTLVVTSHKINACSAIAPRRISALYMLAWLLARAISWCKGCRCNNTTKVLVKCRILINCLYHKVPSVDLDYKSPKNKCAHIIWTILGAMYHICPLASCDKYDFQVFMSTKWYRKITIVELSAWGRRLIQICAIYQRHSFPCHKNVTDQNKLQIALYWAVC